MTEIKREFIHASYARSNFNYEDDLLMVKEKIHHPDGRIEPNVRFIKNYQRDYYITKPEFRDHEQKKEYEFMTKLEKHTTNQAKLAKEAARRLDMWGVWKLSDVSESPFLYGSDVSTPTLVQKEYETRWPNLHTPATMAVNDYETDMLGGDGLMIIGAQTMKEKATLAIRRSFMDKLNLPKDEDELRRLIYECMRKNYGEVLDERGIGIPEIVFVDTPSQVAAHCLKRAHEWKPDFLAYWNMAFDINHMIAACAHDGVDPASIFSDPSVPEEYRTFRFREGKLKKIKADGKSYTQHHCDLWHVVTAMSSFYFVDKMCFFKHNRVGDGMRSSYSLDSVLADYTNVKKMRVEGVDEEDMAQWHRTMQSDYPIEYCAYALFDCISPEILDEKTGDISKSIRSAAGITELSRIKSTPSQAADDYHFVLLEQDKVICSVSSDMTEELDKHTPSIGSWIVTLAAELEYKMTIPVNNEYPNLITNTVTHCLDVDVKSCYPTAGSVCNVGKSTNRLEVCGLVDGDDTLTRRHGVNLTSAKTNALEICNDLMGYPDLEVLLADYQVDRLGKQQSHGSDAVDTNVAA